MQKEDTKYIIAVMISLIGIISVCIFSNQDGFENHNTDKIKDYQQISTEKDKTEIKNDRQQQNNRYAKEETVKYEPTNGTGKGLNYTVRYDKKPGSRKKRVTEYELPANR